MRHTAMWASILALAAIGVGLPGAASAQSVSIGVQTNNVQLGINLGPTPPRWVAVPGAPPESVYYAPNLPYNYFAYHNVYYLYHDARWFRGRHYDGPWRAIAIDDVPRPVLAVPGEHYRNRPERWAHQGPPPWAHEREREHQWEQAHGRGQDRDRGPHDRGRGEGHG